jgi:hypothetical protein
MSAVFLHVGQCGNQIGFQFWKQMLNEVDKGYDTAFDRYTGMARAVMVDSEPKVVRSPFKDRSHPLYSSLNPENCIEQNDGRGNNWAMGYKDSPVADSPPLCELTMNVHRKEVERCDMYRGTVMMHSVAGGTGSGLGSKLAEKIREEYPTCFLITASVLPSSQGDTPLQDYNSCLTLSHINEVADGIIYYENDAVFNAVQYASGRSAHVSTHNLNECIAYSLINILYPRRGCNLDFSGFLSSLVPSELYKFCEVHSSPFLVDKNSTMPREASWLQVLENCTKRFPSHEMMGQLGPLCISARCIMRGDDVETVKPRDKQYINKIHTTFPPVAWMSSDYLKVQYIKERAGAIPYKIERNITLAANRTGILIPLQRLLSSARSKLEVG